MTDLVQMLVGPTVLPDRVRKAMDKPAIPHRTDEYRRLQHSVLDGIKKLFKTENEVLMLTASGTGALEAVVQNLFEPGDKIVIPITGNFGELLYNVAAPYGLDIKRVDFPMGSVADLDQTLDAIDEDTKALFMVHNESSTGALNDIQAFGEALKDRDILFIVDAVSSAGGVDIHMDDWNIDVLLTASQKALSAPPGLSFVALNDKAWGVVEEVDNQRFYFNFNRDREHLKDDITVHTPATHTMYAVQEALKLIEEEGYDQVLNRHKQNALTLRQGIQDMGIELLVKDHADSSPTVTGVMVPGQSIYFQEELLKRNIQVSWGLGPIADDSFRIGTMGAVSPEDVDSCLKAMQDILEQ